MHNDVIIKSIDKFKINYENEEINIKLFISPKYGTCNMIFYI
jgi:hypothetical protein